MAWTKQAPTAPGCYWWRKQDKPDALLIVVQLAENTVVNKLTIVGATHRIFDITVWWTAPDRIGGEWWDTPIASPSNEAVKEKEDKQVSELVERLWDAVVNDTIGRQCNPVLKDVIRRQIRLDSIDVTCDWWNNVPMSIIGLWSELSMETRLAVHATAMKRR